MVEQRSSSLGRKFPAGKTHLRGSLVLALNSPRACALLEASVQQGERMRCLRAPVDPGAILDLCLHFRPCVVVMDEGAAASELLRQLFNGVDSGHDVRVLIRQERQDEGAAMNLVRSGCRGILTRHVTGRLLQKAVERVIRGEYWLSRGQMSRLLQHLLCKQRSGLTSREEQVWSCLARNLTNREIAAELSISPETVRWHIRRLGRKLGVCGRDELSRLWHGRGAKTH